MCIINCFLTFTCTVRYACVCTCVQTTSYFLQHILCLTPTTMYVHRRRTIPCNAYYLYNKKHENEKIIHCFDQKNGCFAIYLHVPIQLTCTTYMVQHVHVHVRTNALAIFILGQEFDFIEIFPYLEHTDVR